ncbi:MAG: pyridoxal phosphate-dependent aminotransferase [Candidatus Aenigmarchaeota archaeon]|nr:pyridoxal phosphate-dependent aminotransferase [Candidatus Aenigmarchaeota archaeon]
MVLNAAIRNTPDSEVSRYFGKVPIDAINFSLGEPIFPPPDSVKKSFAKSIMEGSGRYSSVQGLPDLRKAISDKLERENNVMSDPDDILITNGANEAIAIAILSLVDNGDEVIICEPSFPAFKPLVKYCQGVPKPLFLKEENGFRLDLEELKEAVSDKTKMIVINTPHNPTGSVFDKNTLKSISEICNSHILVDEVYENLVYGVPHCSIASVAGNPERIITVNSFSKTYCMCGYRLGYMHATDDLIKSFMKLKLYLSVCTSMPIQVAGIAALKDKNYPKLIRRELSVRRNILLGGLRGLKIPFVEPDGTFFVFPNISEWGNDMEVHEMFLKAGVLAMPGSIFHPDCSKNIRFSFVADPQDIREGIIRLEGLLA